MVFTRFDEGYNDGPASLFLLDISGGAATRLTPTEDQDNVNLPGAAWNGINDRIVLASDRQEADDLWRIAPDGSDFVRITTHITPTIYIEPSWSPDGQWIVFEASQPGGGEDGRSGQVWKVRADGTALTQLTDGTYDDRQPNWSPAGDRILFQRRTLPSGQWDIYTIAPDGSDLQNVTGNSAADETDASWSPGGTCIVYSSDNITLPVPNIFALPVAGGQPIRMTFSGDNEDGAPSWSPDGQWIAFESHESADENSSSALWRIAVPEGVCDEGFHVYLPITLTSASSSRLLAVNDFFYQLQNLDLTAVGDNAYDLVVTVTAELGAYLDLFKNDAKLVLTVDYATTPAHIDDAYAKSRAKDVFSLSPCATWIS